MKDDAGGNGMERILIVDDDEIFCTLLADATGHGKI